MIKSTKKLVMFLLIALISVVLVACGNSSDEENEEEVDTGNETETTDTDSEEGLRIAIVSSPSGVDDRNFNQNNYEGILSFIENNPNATVQDVVEPTGDPAAGVQAVADIVADYDVIVIPGFQFAEVSNLAVENPEKYFILIDSDPAPVGDQTEFENVYAMTFAEEESGFLVGMAAALETETNKVAVVNGVAFPSNVNYQYGFESGVNYVNNNFDRDVEIVELSGYSGTDVNGEDVGGNYAQSFADPAAGKVIGEALIGEGVDVIFVVAGGSGNGVITAVKEAQDDVKFIGGDVDQFDDGENGSENVTLTSALKVMDMNVEKALQSIVDGNFAGGNVLLQADTDSTGYVKEEGRHQMTEETITAIEEAYLLLQGGEIVPASNFNGHTPEEFPGLDG